MARPILYVCGTPIGNLEDITLRALRILREVGLIAAEDTRQTRKLLTHYDIHKPLLSCHEHNEEEAATRVLRTLENGVPVALVSDAGMPTVSDPGQRLVRKVVEAGYGVEVVPGPSAVIAALAVSGQDTSRWCFEGFLPSRAAERRRRLAELSREGRTLVFYEAPHRLVKLLSDMLDVLGNRSVSIARELTKVHEEVLRLDLGRALEHFRENAPRGEITLVVSGSESESDHDLSDCFGDRREGEETGLDAVILSLLKEGLSTTAVAKEAARRLGIPRNTAYRRALLLVRDGVTAPPV